MVSQSVKTVKNKQVTYTGYQVGYNSTINVVQILSTDFKVVLKLKETLHKIVEVITHL